MLNVAWQPSYFCGKITRFYLSLFSMLFSKTCSIINRKIFKTVLSQSVLKFFYDPSVGTTAVQTSTSSFCVRPREKGRPSPCAKHPPAGHGLCIRVPPRSLRKSRGSDRPSRAQAGNKAVEGILKALVFAGCSAAVVAAVAADDAAVALSEAAADAAAFILKSTAARSRW